MYDSKSSSDEEWVELYNTQHDSIDLSGWYLTDDDNYPATGEGDIIIPNNIKIGPGEYLVVSWSDLSDLTTEIIVSSSSGNRGSGPTLSNGGDNIALYSNGNGTGLLIDGSLTTKYTDASPSNVGSTIERNKSGNYADSWFTRII